MANIAMWGPSGSGKTTFLAALSVALTQRGGDWNVTAANRAAANMLIDMTTDLNDDRKFPEATLGVDQHDWALNGMVTETVPKGRFRKETRIKPVTIGLNLADASGEAWRPKNVGPLQEEVVNHLANSQGIVYMFDPIREFQNGDTYGHTFGMCVQLAEKLQVGRLPQYVAVCVTKFDELRVYETARRLNLLTIDRLDRYEFPRVHDDDAFVLFDRLCEVSGSGNGEMVLKVLHQYFHSDRIKFFVSSAIGFYADPRTGRFDPEDPQNLLPDRQAQRGTRIRGPVRPINVVEPVLWLSENITGHKATGVMR